MSNALYLAEGYYCDEYSAAVSTEKNIVSAIAPVTGGYSELLANVRVYERTIKAVEGYGYYECYDLANDVQTLVDYVDYYMLLVKYIGFYAAIGMTVLSVLFILYFTSGVVTEKKREIGILRALGASRADIFKVFGAENGIFAAGLIVLSVALSAVADVIFNAMFTARFTLKATLVSFGVVPFFLIAGVAIAAVALGILIPVVKLLRAKPVDIIAGR